MILAYYKKKDGTIRYFHRVDKVHPETLHERVLEYNKANEMGTGETVHIVEYADDSFEAHLFRRATENMRLTLEALENLRCSIQDADSAICDLIFEAERIARGETE